MQILALIFGVSFGLVSASAFTSPRNGGCRNNGYPTAPSPVHCRSQTLVSASSTGDNEDQGLFKAGLLENLENEAATLASKKIRSVKDLGWKAPAKRRGKIRPRHWAFGGAGEKPVQDKPNYDPSSPMCVERWVSLPEFYNIIKDDTAVADTIFVALAKGGAFIERDVAEEVIGKWRSSGSKFDEGAFRRTVQEGRRDFLLGWAAFVTFTGIAVAGIVFPTNPLQSALVDFLEYVTGPDKSIVG